MSTPAARSSAESLKTERTTVRRSPRRGAYDRREVYGVLDDGLFCHVAFVADGEPFSIPMVYGRLDDMLYLHGAPGSRLLRSLRGGARACASVTLLDALVVARSAFNHTMNYRSVVVLGTARQVIDDTQKRDGLRAVLDHAVPGTWDYARSPTQTELDRTLLVELPVEEASVKSRSGPPPDDDADYTLPIWGGELPVCLSVGEPVGDERLLEGVGVPSHVLAMRRRRSMLGSG